MARPKQRSSRPNVVTRSVRAAEKRIFPFLKLSPELRNEIYKMVLQQHTHTIVDARLTQYRKAPNVLLLNRQIYQEAISILYGFRDFWVDVPWTLETNITDFIRSIGPINAAMIRRFTFEVHYCCRDHSAALPGIIRSVSGALPKVRMLKEVTLDLIDCTSRFGVLEVDRQQHFEKYIRPLLEPLREFTGLRRLVVNGHVPEEYVKSLRMEMEAKD